MGFAAASVMAACLAPGAALADAKAPPTDDEFWQAALASARLAASEAFAEAAQDWSRARAQQGGGEDAAAPRPRPPTVELDGRGFLSVTIPLLPGADAAALAAAVDEALDVLARRGSSSSSQQQQSRQLGTSRVVQWDVSRTLRGPPPPPLPPPQQQQQRGPAAAPGGREQLSVQLVVPLQPGWPHEGVGGGGGPGGPSAGGRGYLSVAKPGCFAADELALVARLVAAANTPGSAPGGGGGVPPDAWAASAGGGLDDSPLGRMVGRLLAELESDLSAWRQRERPDWDDIVGRWQGFFGGFADQLPRQLQDQLQEQLQAQLQELQELAPPEVVTWLQRVEEEQRREAQERRQQQQGREEAAGGAATRPQSGGGGGGAGAGAGAGPAAPEQQQTQQEALRPWEQPAARAALQQLQQLGAQVYLPNPAALAPQLGEQQQQQHEQQHEQHEQQQQQQQQQHEQHEQQQPLLQGWGDLAGYEEQKQALEDSLLLPLKFPEVFDRIASRTRKSAQPGGSRLRAVLFEGPPGTGKTSSARLLASRAALPLVYVPLEALVSKWYGESEQNLAKLFKACEALGGCLIFLDELDSLATSRDRSDMHEASRRLLGVMLREIDGFQDTLGSGEASPAAGGGGGGGGGRRRSVLIGATNRRQDLDAALLSRFGLSIHFGLPDERTRAAILGRYAAHLPERELQRLAAACPGFSGRDLRDVCEQAERAWASRIIRGEVGGEELPGPAQYLEAVAQRRQGAGQGAGGVGRSGNWGVSRGGLYTT